GAAVVFADGFLNVLRTGYARLYLHVQQMTQTVERVEVGRIAQGYGHRIVVAINRDDVVFLGDVPRNRGDDIVGQPHLTQVDEFDAELRSLRLGDLPRRDDFPGDERVHQPFTARIGFLPDGAELFIGHQPHVHEGIYQIVISCGHNFLSLPGSSVGVWRIVSNTNLMSNVHTE